MNSQRLVECARASVSDELRKAPWRGSSNRMAGHCYVVSEALYHLMGGKAAGIVPLHMVHDGVSHWALRLADGSVLDATADQFTAQPDYSKAVGSGFLTKRPSKRASILLERIKRMEGSNE